MELAEEYIQRHNLAAVMSERVRYPKWYAKKVKMIDTMESQYDRQTLKRIGNQLYQTLGVDLFDEDGYVDDDKVLTLIHTVIAETSNAKKSPSKTS